MALNKDVKYVCFHISYSVIERIVNGGVSNSLIKSSQIYEAWNAAYVSAENFHTSMRNVFAIYCKQKPRKC